ncbi:MAG: phosphatase domain-containing protein [Jannaschia sp.]
MLKPLVRRAARLVETGLERIGTGDASQPVLEPYFGYAADRGLVIRGRVLTSLRRTEPSPEASKWANLRQMATLFITDEVADVTVRGGGVDAVTDAEGYFTLHVPGDFLPGWAEIMVALDGQDPVPFIARVPGPEARHMVISDIDDTIIRTGAHSLARNLWTTFTGSALSREAYADAIALVEDLAADGNNPVFYVSSSPWNLHNFLDRLFTHRGVPRGPMFLRDLGLTEEGVGESHGRHKGAAIDAILAANPDLSAYLLGDTGQHDARVYRDAVLRHPGRIRGVALREPVPGLGANDADAISAIEAAGVPCYHAPTFDGATDHWGPR